MATDSEVVLVGKKRCRGVVRASFTRMETRIKDLERKEAPSTADHATVQCMQEKLDGLDAEFRTYHFDIVELVDNESLETEQAALDKHDDKVSSLSTRIQQLLVKWASDRSSTTSKNPRSGRLRRHLDRIDKEVCSIESAIGTGDSRPKVDACTLSRYQEHLGDLKKELLGVSHDILRRSRW